MCLYTVVELPYSLYLFLDHLMHAVCILVYLWWAFEMFFGASMDLIPPVNVYIILFNFYTEFVEVSSGNEWKEFGVMNLGRLLNSILGNWKWVGVLHELLVKWSTLLYTKLNKNIFWYELLLSSNPHVDYVTCTRVLEPNPPVLVICSINTSGRDNYLWRETTMFFFSFCNSTFSFDILEVSLSVHTDTRFWSCLKLLAWLFYVVTCELSLFICTLDDINLVKGSNLWLQRQSTTRFWRKWI